MIALDKICTVHRSRFILADVPDGIALREDAMTAIALLSRAQRALVCAVGESVGLPPHGIALLRLLARCASLTTGDIAAALRVDVSVVSRQVSAMVDLGLVERTVDPADRRVHRLGLTGAGRDAHARVNAEIGARAEVGFVGWTAADLDEVATLTRRLADAVERSAAVSGARAGPPPVVTT